MWSADVTMYTMRETNEYGIMNAVLWLVTPPRVLPVLPWVCGQQMASYWVSCVVNGCGMREGNSFWMAFSTLRKRFTFSVAFYDVFVIRFSFSLKEATITISFSWRVSSIGTNTVFQNFLDGRQVGGLEINRTNKISKEESKILQRKKATVQLKLINDWGIKSLFAKELV